MSNPEKLSEVRQFLDLNENGIYQARCSSCGDKYGQFTSPTMAAIDDLCPPCAHNQNMRIKDFLLTGKLKKKK